MKRMKQIVALVISGLIITSSVQGPVISVFASEPTESMNEEEDNYNSANDQLEQEGVLFESSTSVPYEEDVFASGQSTEEDGDNVLDNSNNTEKSAQNGVEISFDDENVSLEEDPQYREENTIEEENAENVEPNTEDNQFMPAIVLSKEIEGTGTLLVVKAEEGTFPEGTNLDASYIENAELTDVIIEASKDEPSEIRILWMDFLDAEGHHIDPHKEFYTEIRMDNVERTKSLAVFQINEDEQVFSVEKLDEEKAEIVFNQSEEEDIVSFRASGINNYALVYYGGIDTVEELQEDSYEWSEINGMQDDVAAKQSVSSKESETNSKQENNEVVEHDEEDGSNEPGNVEYKEKSEDTIEASAVAGASKRASTFKKDSAVPTPLTGLNGEVVIASGYCGEKVQWYLHEDGTMWIFGRSDKENHYR